MLGYYYADKAKLIAAGGSGVNEVRVFDRNSGNVVGVIPSQPKGIYAVHFSPNNKNLLFCGGEGRIGIADL